MSFHWTATKLLEVQRGNGRVVHRERVHSEPFPDANTAIDDARKRLESAEGPLLRNVVVWDQKGEEVAVVKP